MEGVKQNSFILAILRREISILGRRKFFYDMNILIFDGYQCRKGHQKFVGMKIKNFGESENFPRRTKNGRQHFLGKIGECFIGSRGMD